MSEQRTVLIVDDSKRFSETTPFEPEFQVWRADSKDSALAFLRAHPGTTITVINLESAVENGLALLAAIREQQNYDAMVVWFCVEPDDKASMERSYQGGADELIFRLPDNSSLQYQVRRLKAFPIRYEDGETPVYLAGVSGIPSRYRLEKVLRESDLKLASVMNAVPGGIALYDFSAQPRLLYSNETLSRMCGYSATEYRAIMEKDYRQLIAPEDVPIVEELISRFRSKPERLEGTFRIITKSRDIRWVRVSATPADNGQQCSVVFIDVTKDKENELKNERMQSELLFHSEHDTLTGIFNRETFYRKTAAMLRANPGTPYVVLVLDIDRFKVVNDLFGKEAGDHLLKTIAEGLRELADPVGTCARMEADHFSACLPRSTLDMDRIQTLFQARLEKENLRFHVQLYYGIYPIHNIGTPVNHMCDRAVMALRTVKGNALKRYAFYDDKLRQTMLEENAVLDEMSSALEQGQFVPFLQPIFSMESDQPVSAEMLVRWQHPDKGLISPAQFIPLFERNGFITRLDTYIWEQACKLLNRWKKQNYPLPISVNISRIDLYYVTLCDDLLALVKRYGIEPSQLRLEITESAYAKDPVELVETLERLRAAGFIVLMDDFGSGYSSLNVLMDMPVDILKMDSRFLTRLNTNPRAASILTSVVHMAKWLNIPIVAEGVETPEQLAFLRSIGCDQVQGYLMARPMSVANYDRRFVRSFSVPAVPADRSGTVDLSLLWGTSAQIDTLFNGMIGGMGVYELADDRLEIRRVNDGFYELFGYTPKQVFDNSLEALKIVHPDDRAPLLDACRRSAQSGRVERLVCRFVHLPDDHTLWLEIRLRFMGKAGSNGIYLFTFNDVTEQKEFEHARALRTYAMVLSTVYASVFEINLTTWRTRAIHKPTGNVSEDAPDKSCDHLKAFLRRTLAEPDDELLRSVFTPGYLRSKLKENVGEYYMLERQVKGENGLPRWASFTFISIPSDTAEEVYLLCIADVNSRKHAEELRMENQWLLLKQREQSRYQTLLEHLGTSLFEWETDTGKMLCSPGFQRYALGGFDFRQLRSHKDLEPFVDLRDLNQYRLMVSDLLSRGNTSAILRLLEKDGASVWCRLLCLFTKESPDGSPRCIGAISRIDEQMKIRESFLDEQSRFQAFAENFMVGLGIFELRGNKQRILYLSNGYRQMVGFNENEPFYDEQHPFSTVYAEDVPRFLEATRTLQRTGKPYMIDYRVYHKNGSLLWMRSHNSIYPGPEAGTSRVFAVIEDISELKALQARLDQSGTPSPDPAAS